VASLIVTLDVVAGLAQLPITASSPEAGLLAEPRVSTKRVEIYLRVFPAEIAPGDCKAPAGSHCEMPSDGVGDTCLNGLQKGDGRLSIA
jgi:hypothetical protein